MILLPAHELTPSVHRVPVAVVAAILAPIRAAALSPERDLRQVALNVVCLMLRQGLVNPLDVSRIPLEACP